MILIVIGLMDIRENYEHHGINPPDRFSDWTMTDDTGSTRVTLPVRFSKKGATTFETTLPEITPGQELWIHVKFNSMKAYVDGKQICEIMKIAGTEMYHNKSDYYKKSGLDRRR